MATAIIFATKGRPGTLRSTLKTLAQQTQQPHRVIISCVSDADVRDLEFPGGFTLLKGLAGLTQQRNAALRAVPRSADIVAFFDDDFVPHCRWIEEVERFFREHKDVVGVTGNLIADGVKGPGFTVEEALRLLEHADPRQANWARRPYSPYGCNMAFRMSAIADLAFDERLVLYGWQEDRDFGARLAKRGHLVKLGSAMGVHLGMKGGRVSGGKLGYSQIANPVYLYSKGTMTLASATSHIFRNFASNLARSVRPEPYIDRPGRLRGNLVAMWDVARGRVYPERAESL